MNFAIVYGKVKRLDSTVDVKFRNSAVIGRKLVQNAISSPKRYWSCKPPYPETKLKKRIEEERTLFLSSAL
ncbi:unnamed protein product [Protopolystoma xenopodis]|uniref:Uncharacterized protein n=1 Tax=Protopolystoma xenopodis TaxID=117903 RepID=A0A3S5BF08_9PLAT|nr:unnamed protein product [Protopolystoma xenopodis]